MQTATLQQTRDIRRERGADGDAFMTSCRPVQREKSEEFRSAKIIQLHLSPARSIYCTYLFRWVPNELNEFTTLCCNIIMQWFKVTLLLHNNSHWKALYKINVLLLLLLYNISGYPIIVNTRVPTPNFIWPQRRPATQPRQGDPGRT